MRTYCWVTIDKYKKPFSIKIWIMDESNSLRLIPKYIGQHLTTNKRMLKYAKI